MKRVGVDIGSSAVRVVQVTGTDSGGYATIGRFGIAQLGEGAVVAGKIRNPQAVSMSLIRALKAAGASKYGFVVGLSSPEVAVGHLTLPASIEASERNGAIRAQEIQISPTVPLSESALSTNLVSVETTGENLEVASLVAAAALQSEVDLLRQVCRLANCTPQAIDLAGAATMRVLVRDRLNSTHVSTVVDIGSTKTTIVTREGLHLRSIRTAPGGGSELTRAIAGAGEWSYAEGEVRKKAMHVGRRPTPSGRPGIDDASGYVGYGFVEETQTPGADQQLQSNVEDAMNSAIDMLVDQVAQSIEMDASNYGSMTKGVTIVGGTALLRGLKDRLQQRIGVEVHVGRPWAHLDPSKRHAGHFNDGVEDPQLMMELTTATGLALWRKER